MNYTKYTVRWKNIFLVDMRNETSPNFSLLLKNILTTKLNTDEKFLIIWQKKWFAWGIICQKCWNIPNCSMCDIPIWYHQISDWTFIWLCHICKHQYDFPKKCVKCNSTEINMYGIWYQQIQEILNKYWYSKSTILDTEKIRSPKKYADFITEIKNSQILIWSSMITTPSNHFKPSFAIVLNGDIWLNIPDFAVNEKHYLWLLDLINRFTWENIIIQTSKPEFRSYQAALLDNPDLFYNPERAFRKKSWFPPFSEFALILYKNEIEERLYTKVNQLFQELLYLKEKLKFEWEIFSTPPLIYKTFGKYRYNIVIKGKNVHSFLEQCHVLLKLNKQWFKIDRLPQNLL